MSVLGPVSRRVFLVLLALNLLLRLLLATLPGYESDIELYRDWAIGAARWGIPAAYETTSVDYPPPRRGRASEDPRPSASNPTGLQNAR
jgi:hypothetical protein